MANPQDIVRARAGDKNLRGADLFGANLTGADLTGADLTGANLRYAVLVGASLINAILTGADLSHAFLTGAELTGAELTGAVGYYAYVPPERRRTSGRATGAALKLAAPDAPLDPREFKKRFPREFDLLARRGLAGRPFRPEAIAAIQKQLASPVEWVVTKKRYTSRAQRYCSGPNDVLLLNIDLTDPHFTEHQRSDLRKIARDSRHPQHPYEKGDLFTIGWVRYCVGPGAWLIEEVQSGVRSVRFGPADPRTLRHLASVGVQSDISEDSIAALAPYAEAFYRDAIGLVFELAHQAGVEVEMLEYGFKIEDGGRRGFWWIRCPQGQKCHPPKDIYTDLPREMGMQLRKGSRVLPDISDAQVWAYRPNPARSRSRRRRASR